MYYQEYGRKYKNVNKEYGGHTYHSKREAEYAHQLDLLKKARDKYVKVDKWERQHKIDIRVHGVHICNYYVDFKVWFADGRIEIHEVKGFATDTWKLKWKLTEAIFATEHPEIGLKVIK